jgi:hypothetical protein
VSAKRAAPKPVKPVVKDGIEYSAPLNREGFVVATWIKTGCKIWSRQVYVIKHEYKQGLEEDVQTCFITHLQFHDRKLQVTNEQGGEFEVDPDTLVVTVLKGKPVLDYTSCPSARTFLYPGAALVAIAGALLLRKVGGKPLGARAFSIDKRYSHSIPSAKEPYESFGRSRR